jgi:hypothetical protein
MNDDEWSSDDDSGREEECLLMSDASVPNNHATSFTQISHSMALAAYILPKNLTLGVNDSIRFSTQISDRRMMWLIRNRKSFYFPRMTFRSSGTTSRLTYLRLYPLRCTQEHLNLPDLLT